MNKETINKSTPKTPISFTIRTAGKIHFVLIDHIAYVYLEGETVYLVDFDGDKHPIANHHLPRKPAARANVLPHQPPNHHQPKNKLN